MALNPEFEIELSTELSERVNEVNVKYLMLLRDISKRDLSASMTLGLSNGVIDIFSACPVRKLLEISSAGILIPKLRFDNEKFWKSVSDGAVDANDIVHNLLKEG